MGLTKIVSVAVFSLCFIIGVARAFGALEGVEWIGDNLLHIVLVLLSTIGAMQLIIQNELEEVKRKGGEIHEEIRREPFDNIRDIENHIDKNLYFVFEEHLHEIISGIEQAIKHKKVNLSDTDLFRWLYIKTLERFSGSQFYATSLPTKQYFWKSPALEDSMKRFISSGGKVKRVFFVGDEYDVEADVEANDIIRDHCSMGVETYVIPMSKVSNRYRKYFVVESENSIAWEVVLGSDGAISQIVGTSDQSLTRDYINTFNCILSLGGIRRMGVEAGGKLRVIG